MPHFLRALQFVGVAAALVAAFAATAQVQTQVEGTITTQNVGGDACTAGGCVEIDVAGKGVVAIQVRNTYTGALSGQLLINGSWVTLADATAFTNKATRAQAATIASGATGIFLVDAVGASRFRLTALLGAVTGEARVSILASPVSPGSGSGGGGGGGDASAANQVTGNTSLASIDTKTPSLGTQSIANSRSVTPATSSTWAATQSGTWNVTNISGTVSLPTGASTSANQSTTNTSIGATNESAAASDTATSGLNGLIKRLLQQVAVWLTSIGATNESAAGSDTATSGLNGLLKRIAQNITTLTAAVNADASTTGTVGSTVPTKATLIGHSDGTNIVALRADPCQTTARSYAPISIASATTTRIITPTSSQKAYICGLFLIAAGAQNVGIVEGTGGTCGTGTAGVIGGTTAGTGPNLTAQVGFVLPNTGYSQAATAGTNVDVCLITSASAQLTGHVVYVKAP